METQSLPIKVIREALGVSSGNKREANKYCKALVKLESTLANFKALDAMVLTARVDYVLSDVVSSYRISPRLLYSECDVLKLAKPAKIKRVADSNQTLFGIELEFLSPYVDFSELTELLNIGVFKHEGSVSYGAEFVTLPYTYTQLRGLLRKLSTTLDKMLSKNVKDSENECGMHIHVSKKGLSKLEIARIFYLLNYGYARSYWVEQAGRPTNEYCEYTKLSGALRAAVKSGEEPTEGWDEAFGNSRFRKYKVLNLNLVDTIEFRMFKSPNNAAKVIENLGLVASIIDYVKSGGYTLAMFKRFRQLHSQCDIM